MLCVCRCVRNFKCGTLKASRNMFPYRSNNDHNCVDVCKPMIKHSVCQTHRPSVGENNNKCVPTLLKWILHNPPPLLLLLHCPSASYKSRLSSADAPLKFRNAPVGFEAQWVMGTPGRDEGGPSKEKKKAPSPTKGNMLTANKVDRLVLVVSYPRCGLYVFETGMHYKPTDGMGTLIIFTVGTEHMLTCLVATSDGKGIAAKERERFCVKTEGYKNRTWPGSGPRLPLSSQLSRITFFKPACSKSPICLLCPSWVTALHLFVYQPEQRLVWICCVWLHPPSAMVSTMQQRRAKISESAHSDHRASAQSVIVYTCTFHTKKSCEVS